MLVYYKEPNGYFYMADGTKVGGAHTDLPPRDIPYSVWREYSEVFVNATYRAEDLERIFGRKFTPVAFKYTEIKHLPSSILTKLAEEMGVLRAKRRSREKMIYAIQTALKYGTGKCWRCQKEFVLGHPSDKYCSRKCHVSKKLRST